MKFFRQHPFFIRLLNWEYWSFHAVYGPIYPVWLILCLRARALFYFNLGNPGLENGGFLMESKYKIYQQLPEGSYPATIKVESEIKPERLLQYVESTNWSYPLLAKPDIGMRGLAVKKLESSADLFDYLEKSTVPFLVQQFVSYPREAGIFYYRIPGQEKGRISGIVYKEVLSIKGDGIRTARELLSENPRYRLQIPALQKEWGSKLDTVPAPEEVWEMPYGNHARGALFLDATHQANEELNAVIDNYCRQIEGFYFGRLDIRFESWDLLRQGKQFSVIELNGSGSEPTHMYDPSHSLFFAWKEIIRHWAILNKISRLNRRMTGLPYFSFRQGRQMFRANAAYLKKLKSSALVS